MAKVVLIDEDKEYVSEVKIIEKENSFSYLDYENNLVKIDIFYDGLVLKKKSKDYELNLNLRSECFIEIINCEGIMKFSAKVVEFYRNNDILVMHYLLEGQDKNIKIYY